jgi:hypothetical protein
MIKVTCTNSIEYKYTDADSWAYKGDHISIEEGGLKKRTIATFQPSFVMCVELVEAKDA